MPVLHLVLAQFRARAYHCTCCYQTINETCMHDRRCADATHPARSQVESVLASVGFSEQLRQAPVATLSGGWKMKLALGAPELVPKYHGQCAGAWV